MDKGWLSLNQSAQTIVEYAAVLAIITAVLIAMTPVIRRGTQGMIRTVADQVGIQNESDQIKGAQSEKDQGYLVYSYSATRMDTNKEKKEFVRVTNYVFAGDTISTTSNTFLNLGFVETLQ